tara:strand:- start:3360 stop:3764 length:405 start_codon:yes stop_codon:yes gene_type:complete
MRRKFDINELSPGLENTQKYGTKKYSSTQKKKLDNSYKEFLKLNLLNKTKKYYNVIKEKLPTTTSIEDTNIIEGKNRVWKVWTIKNPTTITIQGKNRVWTIKNPITITVAGKNRVWTLKNSKKKKKKRKKKIIK